jgi:hypothetical protein
VAYFYTAAYRRLRGATWPSFAPALIQHLKRLMSEYVRYYHDDRTHLALEKKTPAGREDEIHLGAGCKVISMPRLGGLYHRYGRAA